jgi:hypothetical protein
MSKREQQQRIHQEARRQRGLGRSHRPASRR